MREVFLLVEGLGRIEQRVFVETVAGDGNQGGRHLRWAGKRG